MHKVLHIKKLILTKELGVSVVLGDSEDSEYICSISDDVWEQLVSARDAAKEVEKFHQTAEKAGAVSVVKASGALN